MIAQYNDIRMNDIEANLMMYRITTNVGYAETELKQFNSKLEQKK